MGKEEKILQQIILVWPRHHQECACECVGVCERALKSVCVSVCERALESVCVSVCGWVGV